MQTSYNFGFLAVHDRQLVRLGALAEQYFPTDPNTCLIKLRQFGELLAQLVAANVGLYEPDLRQVDLLRRLRDRGILRGDVDRLFHELRMVGNEATHALEGDARTALSCLKYARWLGVWFHRTITKDRNFDPGSFLPPPNPIHETEALKAELEKMRNEMRQSAAAIAAAQLQVQTETEGRIAAETLAAEIEAQHQAVLARLSQIQATAQHQPQQALQQTVNQAQTAEVSIVLDERETRRLIEQQLRRAGWEVDSEEWTYAKGIRPQKGHNLAIAEYPTREGRADYALFVGLQIVAVVEAKRQSTDVAEGALNQAKRYSRGFEAKDGVVSGGSWGDYQVPFVFATNGRPFLQQIRTKSGIWFCDLRRSNNLGCPLQTWYSPQGLIDALSQDVDAAHTKLSQEGFELNETFRQRSNDAN